MQRIALIVAGLTFAACAGAQPPPDLPFEVNIETYRSEDGVIVFALNLEQPFLADAFEQTNYIRIRPLSDQAYLVYPKQTRFERKHAAFFGRLRGSGAAALEITYETVTEDVDGSRRVVETTAPLTITIPNAPTGADRVFKAWARHQNEHFAELLTYFPNDSFLQFALLSSARRHERVKGYVRRFPGMRDVLELDPTLTDLNWLGGRLSLHLADDSTIVEVDPASHSSMTTLSQRPAAERCTTSSTPRANPHRQPTPANSSSR